MLSRLFRFNLDASVLVLGPSNVRRSAFVAVKSVEFSLVGEFLPDRFISSAELLEDSMFELELRFVFLVGE